MVPPRYKCVILLVLLILVAPLFLLMNNNLITNSTHLRGYDVVGLLWNCTGNVVIPSVQKQMQPSSNARDILKATTHRTYNGYVLLKNHIPAEKAFVGTESVTYTTHSDPTFLDNLVPLVTRWRGPISVAIYCPGTDYDLALEAVAFYRHCDTKDNVLQGHESQEKAADMSSSQLVRDFVTFHFFFEFKHRPTSNVLTAEDVESMLQRTPDCKKRPPSDDEGYVSFRRKNNLTYPVNVARNLARTAATTHFVLPSDIELYPNPGLISAFLNMFDPARQSGVKTRDFLARPNPKVFVVSIFEIQKGAVLPDSKQELLKLLAEKVAIPFHKKMCSKCHRVPGAVNWVKEDSRGNC